MLSMEEIWANIHGNQSQSRLLRQNTALNNLTRINLIVQSEIVANIKVALRSTLTSTLFYFPTKHWFCKRALF